MIYIILTIYLILIIISSVILKKVYPIWTTGDCLFLSLFFCITVIIIFIAEFLLDLLCKTIEFLDSWIDKH